MASAVSLAEAITAIRQRTNLERKFNFITDRELVGYYNYLLAELYDLLVSVGGQEWYRKTWPIVTNTTDDTYPLPPDFYKLTSAEIEFSTNVVSVLTPYMEGERARYQRTNGWADGRPVQYRMLGLDRIRLIPSPGGAYTVRLNGYPRFERLRATYTDSTGKQIRDAPDAFDGVNGWEEMPIWKAVAYCQQKQDLDYQFALQRAAELDQRIRAMAINRDMQGPERVQDVVGFGDGWDY